MVSTGIMEVGEASRRPRAASKTGNLNLNAKTEKSANLNGLALAA